MINIIFSSTFIFVLGFLVIKNSSPRFSNKTAIYLTLLFLIKILFSIIYFNELYVLNNGIPVELFEYGDSHLYHKVALIYIDEWNKGELFSNPLEIATLLTQWGYGYFLAIVYYFFGPYPEIGILFNDLFYLIMIIYCRKMYLNYGADLKLSTNGMFVVSFMPILWQVSSTLTKDSMMFMLVILNFNSILEIKKKIKLTSVIIFLVSVTCLLLLRYSYAMILTFIMFFSIITQGNITINKILIISLIFCLIYLGV